MSLIEQQEEPLPAGIEATMDLIREGMENDSLIVLRQNMNDTGAQVVYDLAVASVVQGTMSLIPVARLFPQYVQEELLDSTTAAETSSRLN